MKKYNNLERAIVLSLLVSSGIYGTAFAATTQDDVLNDPEIKETIDKESYHDYDDKNYNSFTVTVNNNNNVTDDDDAIKFESHKEQGDFTVTTTEGNITLDAKDGNGIRTQTSFGSVNLNSAKENVIIAGIHGINSDTDIDVNLTANTNNKIIIEKEIDEDSGDGINLGEKNEGNVTLSALNNNIIKVTSDGIYTEKKGNINLTAGSTSTKNINNDKYVNSNIIIAGNNGIDHRGFETITLSATGANIIKAGASSVLGNTVDKDSDGYRDDKNGDGIRIQGNGNVKVTAGTYNDIAVRDTGLYIHGDSINSKIDLIANGINGTFGNIIYAQENGVQIDSTKEGNAINVTANNGGNSITAENNAVYNNGKGTITITAAKDNLLIAKGNEATGYSTRETEFKGNGVISTNEGLTEVIGENNTIFGTINGILANAGKIEVTATNGNNTIGQYIDENKDSEMGINASNGTVSVTATNDNSIYGAKYGIRTEKGESTVTVEAANGNNTINVKGFYDGNGNLLDNSGDGINVTSESAGTITLNAEKDNVIDVVDDGIYVDTNNSKDITLTAGSTNENNNIITIGNNEITVGNNGIDHRGTGTIKLTATGDNIIVKNDKYIDIPRANDGASNHGVKNQDSGKIFLSANNNTINVADYAVYNVGNGLITLEATNDNNLIGSDEDNGSGIVSGTNGKETKGITTIKATIDNTIAGKHNGIEIYDGTIDITAGNNNVIGQYTEDNETITSNTGIYALGGEVNVTANSGNNTVSGNNAVHMTGGIVNITAGNGIMPLTDIQQGSNNYLIGKTNGVYAELDKEHTGEIKVSATDSNIIGGSNNGIFLKSENGENNVSKIEVIAGNNNIIGQYTKDNETITSNTGINVSSGKVIVTANSLQSQNSIYGTETGILADGNNSEVSLTADYNALYAGDKTFGNGYAIKATNGSNVDVKGDNYLLGAIFVDGNKNNDTKTISKVNLSAINKNDINLIQSSAEIAQSNSGDKIVSALYAKGGEIELTAGANGYNKISTYADLNDKQFREQTIWAQQSGKITIDGLTEINASKYDKNTDIIEDGIDTGEEQDGNSLGIAIAAGTGDLTNAESLPELKGERSTVNLNYEGYGDDLNSSIKGDLVSGYGGLINIQRKDDTVSGGINITGNALAANGGKLNIDLGNNGTWIGRADDYGDAGLKKSDSEKHQEFYHPAFSNKILEGGTVNLTMGNDSTWYVNGQSWITSVNTENAKNATIDLVSKNTNKDNTSHALTIYDLKGNANVKMSLDGNRDVSDMLYVKNADGVYNITLADAVTTADMYANNEKIGTFNGLRFATVGEGSKVKFNVSARDVGAFNVEYEVGTDAYDGNKENNAYNGNSLDVEKPGTSTVDDFFAYQGEEPNAEENTSEIATYARMAEETDIETAATTKATTSTGATNYKLVAIKNESISNENLSDAGKTILNMSKANYSQAVYMDTLNKRLGEERYLEGDEGLWVRMRHDKIDKDSSYEITNNMYELGYDKKYESKDKQGYHRKGAALDYMDGDTSYDDIAGSGETNRKGIWLYDTWIGNKGHYTDYVAKWGHLENSFDLYTKTKGEKVSGEYNNDVYSLSAEWGYKDKLDNDWYFEPQTQLQYARVTGADYETSQGTQVSVDGIDSLIARAGFRLGKDFGEEKKSTFYVKADMLHEFLGDQNITAMDKTTDGKAVSIGYDNDGTWYSVGLGFSTMLSDNSYAFLDVEKLFGNDNDNSYQINGGIQWKL